MSPWRSFLILALFFIDVRVRAEEPANEDCWGKQIPCAVLAAAGQRSLKADKLKLVMGGQSLLQQRDDQTIQLVDGRFYIETKSPVKFQTPFAGFWCASACKAIVERHAAGFTLKALEGEWLVQRLGESKRYELASGLQLTVSEVQTNGLAHMEFPQSLAWDPTVKEWANLFDGPAGLFKAELSRFRPEWKAAVESASATHAGIAGRALASHEASLARQRTRRKAIEKEEQALRALFRRKTLDQSF